MVHSPGALALAHTGMPALDRRYPDIPMRPATPVKREVEHIRHGTLCLMAAYDVRRRKLFGFVSEDPSSTERGQQFGGIAPSPTRDENCEAAPWTRRGRRRIGRRCGCLPGAWVETGHAALPGPGPNRGCNPLPDEPKRRENPPQRPGGRLPRVHRGRSTRSPRPRQAAIPPPIRAEGAVPQRWQLRAKLLPCGTK